MAAMLHHKLRCRLEDRGHCHPPRPMRRAESVALERLTCDGTAQPVADRSGT